MRCMNWARQGCLALIALLYGTSLAFASPWAEVGDNQLRADIEILAAAGVIDDVTTHWPLPWQSIVKDLRDNSLPGQPASVRAAAARVLARARAENSPGLSASLNLDAASKPSVVYGFDGMGRGDGQAQFILDYNSQNHGGAIGAGRLHTEFPRQQQQADAGPILSRGEIRPRSSLWRLSFALVGAGLDFGAVAFQQCPPDAQDRAGAAGHIGFHLAGAALAGTMAIGILCRLAGWPAAFRRTPSTTACVSPLIPLPGLEIGLSRTEEFCGQGHPCAPLRDYFNLNNDPAHINNTNDEGLIDIKYSRISGQRSDADLHAVDE